MSRRGIIRIRIPAIREIKGDNEIPKAKDDNAITIGESPRGGFKNFIVGASQGSKTRMEPDEEQINLKTANEQTPERVTVKRVKIDDEVIALDVVRRAEKRFVFEIMRDNGNRMVASSDEHKKAKRAARAGKSIWKRTVKAALKEKLDQ